VKYDENNISIINFNAEDKYEKAGEYYEKANDRPGLKQVADGYFGRKDNR
jgi:hypothetical protein